ncbi:YfdX protein [Rhodospira trueperi]|uniref:YfdX protein n=2 Tax=Rhodospira trueperi TaxID=69960 RepID=A0A1G7ALS3_9PROT|nr:YfdX protein [Rhodospira trueperi]
MKTLKTISALALAGTMIALPVVNATAQAAGAAVEQASATPTAEDKQTSLKIMDEAFSAIREIHAARLAIFNGEPDQAKKFVNEASSDLAAVQDNVKDFAVDTAHSSKDEDLYVPFDSTLTLSEGFVPSVEKQETLDKANEHLAQGEHEAAIKTLKLADIDVRMSAALIPADASLEHVKSAQSLIDDEKFYEANLALKAVEDSIVIESYDVDSVPTQGSTDNGAG